MPEGRGLSAAPVSGGCRSNPTDCRFEAVRHCALSRVGIRVATRPRTLSVTLVATVVIGRFADPPGASSDGSGDGSSSGGDASSDATESTDGSGSTVGLVGGLTTPQDESTSADAVFGGSAASTSAAPIGVRLRSALNVASCSARACSAASPSRRAESTSAEDRAALIEPGPRTSRFASRCCDEARACRAGSLCSPGLATAALRRAAIPRRAPARGCAPSRRRPGTAPEVVAASDSSTLSPRGLVAASGNACRSGSERSISRR